MSRIIRADNSATSEKFQGSTKCLHYSMIIIVGFFAYYAFNGIFNRNVSNTYQVELVQSPVLKAGKTISERNIVPWQQSDPHLILQNKQHAASPMQPRGSNTEKSMEPRSMHFHREAQWVISILKDIALGGLASSPESIQEINLGFAQLVQMGNKAVPAIQQFLESHDNVDIHALEEEELMARKALREGLFKVLGRIGGHDANKALLGSLELTGDPNEVVLIANLLQQNAPAGQYREQIFAASERSLTNSAQMIAKAHQKARGKPTSKPEGLDARSVFELIRSQGDVERIRELSKKVKEDVPSWSVYEKIALAQLPDGKGIVELTNMLVDSEGEISSENLFALQMLAQASQDHPQAGENLLELVTEHATDIPVQEWRKIAWVLQGNRYELSSQSNDHSSRTNNTTSNSSSRQVDLKSLHLSFFRYSEDPRSWSRDKVARNIKLIDQLLVVAEVSPKGMDALLEVRNRLLEEF